MDIKRTPKWIRVLKQGALFSAMLVAAVAILGFAIQHRKDLGVHETHQAPGSFVNVGGHRIHFRELGEGDVTFVLEAGLGGYSESWNGLDSALAEIGRVFVYDRAGLGWSEEGPHPRTAEQLTTELHLALAAAQVRSPVILVGHSLGGLTHTLYAMRFPGDVAGLLLIDPSHKDQVRKLPGPPQPIAFLMTQVSRTACFGLPQLLMRSRDPITNQTKHVLTSGAELRALFNPTDAWEKRPLNFGPIPIIVLTGGVPAAFPGKSPTENQATWEIWRSLHAELVAASSSEIRKHEVVAGASHHIHRTHPTAIIQAAREMTNLIKVRSAAGRLISDGD